MKYIAFFTCILIGMYTYADDMSAHALKGEASWYGGKFQGRLTANGETFDTRKLTAAHRTLPFDTIVRVHNLNNKKTVEVRINDRGPFVDDRVIDLSRAAADALDATAAGVIPVYLEILHYQEPSNTHVIQVASFSHKRNAQALIQDLASAGITANIEQVKHIHRVIIPQVKKKELSRYTQKLASLGHKNILVRAK